MSDNEEQYYDDDEEFGQRGEEDVLDPDAEQDDQAPYDAGNVNEELFGQDDGDYGYEEEAPQEQPVAKSSGRSDAQERKAALAKLAQGRQAEGEPKSKSSKRRRPAVEADAPKSRRQRRSGGEGDDDDYYAGEDHGGETGGRSGGGGSRRGDRADDDGEEERPEDLVPTADDAAFLDDEGVEQDEQYGSEGEQDYADAPEAIEDEVDEISALLNANKRKRHKESFEDIALDVEAMCTKMDIAAEDDVAAQELRRPAFNKLRLLRELEDFLTQRKYQETFINGQGLYHMAKWLEPYKDDTLPHVKVRETVLRLLELLPISTKSGDGPNHRELLASSELGRRVMFYFLCPDELASNKRIAKVLVERWSRPIFEDEEDPEALAERRARQRDLQRMRSRKQQAHMEQAKAAVGPQLKPGDPGFRLHASIPQASKLDYTVVPESNLLDMEGSRGSGSARDKPNSGLTKKLREFSRKQKAGIARAMKPSVEGRGML